MTRAKTLRRVRKPQKKVYKGGQILTLDYKDIQDVYASNLEIKKKLYETIKKEASQLYDVETSNKTDTILDQVKLIVSFIADFYSSKLTDFNNVRDKISEDLEKYGLQYTSYFIPSLKEYQIYINEIEELMYYVKQIQSEFLNKKIHIHLIQQRYNLLENAKELTNVVNKKIETLKESIDSTVKMLESDKSTILQLKQSIIQETEIKKLELITSIDIVKREYPESFIPKEPIFIQGCPLGSVLDSKECQYYNDTTLIETVPLQEKLLNTDTSEWVVWFNNITPNNINDPLIFKRKQLQYLMRLTKEDSKYFDSQYVVSEQSGAPYKDPNGFLKFVAAISETPLNIPGFKKYYIDNDGFPQAVQIVDVESPKLRMDLNTDKYFCALNDIDQIISGIQYIQTDKDGNYSDIVPFYPNYENFSKTSNNYSKISLNDIDTTTYRFVKQFTNQIDNLINKTVYDTSSLDPYMYNLISPFYKNKYIEISIDKYYNPFVFPQFFLEVGDYFLVQNTSSRQLIFNISSNEDEKRMVLYPKQVVCFIYSSNKQNSSQIDSQKLKLNYGYLILDRYLAYQLKSSKVAKYRDTYIFVENSKPLYDSEENLITVPNFSESAKVYYEYDDMFETTPKTVSEIVSLEVVNRSISLEFASYVSPYITLCTNGNIFVFCDVKGNPLLDVLGYFIPVPSPVHYDNTNYSWNLLEKQKIVKILTDYINVVSIDDFYDYSTQFNSEYFSSVNGVKIFINRVGAPLIANKLSYLALPEVNSAKEKTVQIFLPENFKITLINTIQSKKHVKSQMLVGLLKIYTQNTQLLEDYYKDISGNMNNFKELKAELFNILNRIEVNTVSEDLDKDEIDAKRIYKIILETSFNLQSYVEKQKQLKIYNTEIDKIKIEKNSELKLIRSKLDKIKIKQTDLNKKYEILNNDIQTSSEITPIEKGTLFIKISKVPIDLQSLDLVKNSLESSYVFVDDSVKTAETGEELMLQNQTINILIKGVTSLEQNQESELTVLNNIEKEIATSKLVRKNEEKNVLVDLIKAEKLNLDNYKISLKEVKENEVVKKITASITKIENTIKQVDSEQNILVVPTVEIINKQIETYKDFLERIIPAEKAIIEIEFEKVKENNDKDSIKLLVEQRNVLLQRINLFKENNDSINNLLNSLKDKISDEERQRFETELLENYNLVEDIEENINTNTSIETSLERVDEIEVFNKKIQNELQIIELDTQSLVPEPVYETVINSSATPIESPNKGGGKKWKTRRHKQKKLIISK